MKKINVKNIISNSLEQLFPTNNSCIFCGEELFNTNEYCICEKCLLDLPKVDKTCIICGQEIFDMGDLCLSCKQSSQKFYDRAFSPYRYENKIVDIIHNLKYHNDKWLGKYLSKIMYDYVKDLDLQIDVVIPVPLNENRLKERGYNQSKLLCYEFDKNGIVVDETNVIRVKNTKTQTNFSFKQRQENMENAFKVLNKEKLNGKNLLIVDDVYTTGATLNELSKTLRKTKVNNIYCLTLAHAVKWILSETNKLP